MLNPALKVLRRILGARESEANLASPTDLKKNQMIPIRY